jgi:hypothetical protein
MKIKDNVINELFENLKLNQIIKKDFKKLGNLIKKINLKKKVLQLLQ